MAQVRHCPKTASIQGVLLLISPTAHLPHIFTVYIVGCSLSGLACPMTMLLGMTCTQSIIIVQVSVKM